MLKIEAATRLSAQELGTQLIGNNAGLRRCREYSKDYARHPKQFTSLGSKGGLDLFFYKDPPFKVLVLVDGDKVVAYLEATKVNESSNATWYQGLDSYHIVGEVFIDQAYRGQKLGTVLHLGAAHIFKRLASDINMAVGAFMSFKSLEKYGYKLGLLNGSTGQKVKFTWGSDGVPVVDGKSMEVSEDNFVLFAK